MQFIKAKGHLPFSEALESSGALDEQKPGGEGRGHIPVGAASGQWYEVLTDGQKGDPISGDPPHPP